MSVSVNTAALDQPGAELCLCVYGVVGRSFRLPDRSQLPDAVELRMSGVGRVAAVYSEFDPAELHDLTPDLREGSRLAIVARRHDEIVRSLASTGAVLPVRLGTLFPDATSLLHLLEDSEQNLGEELDRLRGCSEWDFRATIAPPAAGASPAPTGESAGSGTAYLMQRRDERRHANYLRDSAISAMSAADEALSARAESLAGRGFSNHTMSMSRAYLVSEQWAAEFEAVAAELAAELEGHGCQVAVSGPMPAYSFVDVRLEQRSNG